jgi:hypothetical protein
LSWFASADKSGFYERVAGGWQLAAGSFKIMNDSLKLIGEKI